MQVAKSCLNCKYFKKSTFELDGSCTLLKKIQSYKWWKQIHHSDVKNEYSFCNTTLWKSKVFTK